MPGRVLIVEDHPTMREALRLILEPEGFLVIEAHDGNEAMETIRHATPDVMLLDLGIPGIGGEEVLERVKGDPVTASLPVIVVTATGGEVEEKVLALGAAAFFTKPF